MRSILFLFAVAIPPLPLLIQVPQVSPEVAHRPRPRDSESWYPPHSADLHSIDIPIQQWTPGGPPALVWLNNTTNAFMWRETIMFGDDPPPYDKLRLFALNPDGTESLADPYANLFDSRSEGYYRFGAPILPGMALYAEHDYTLNTLTPTPSAFDQGAILQGYWVDPAPSLRNPDAHWADPGNVWSIRIPWDPGVDGDNYLAWTVPFDGNEYWSDSAWLHGTAVSGSTGSDYSWTLKILVAGQELSSRRGSRGSLDTIAYLPPGTQFVLCDPTPSPNIIRRSFTARGWRQ